MTRGGGKRYECFHTRSKRGYFVVADPKERIVMIRQKGF